MIRAGQHPPSPSDPVDADWAARRRAPRHGDEALTGTTRAWLRRLPASRRPLRLCMQFPRVANHIAWSWNDATLLPQVLDDLLVDRRGGRRGFPRPVCNELRRLREYAANPRAEGWSNGPLAVLRRFWPGD